jgi:hypothetical protein
MLIEAGADPDGVVTKGTQTETPLHWAASSDDADIADALISGGADLETPASWVFTSAHPVCQVTTAASGAVTKTCGLPDVTDFIYVLAVVAILLLPEAKSIKIGSLQFERLTTEVREQKDEITRLSQHVSQVVSSKQELNMFFGAADLAFKARQGDVAEGARPAEEVIREYLDPEK